MSPVCNDNVAMIDISMLHSSVKWDPNLTWRTHVPAADTIDKTRLSENMVHGDFVLTGFWW